MMQDLVILLKRQVFLSRVGEALRRTARAISIDPDLAASLAQAATALAGSPRLMGHPLLGAFIQRGRLEAVRRQAAVDGQLIDLVRRRRTRGPSPQYPRTG